MARKLINKNNIYEFYKKGQDTICLPKNSIISPSANDFIREHNLKLEIGEFCEDKEIKEESILNSEPKSQDLISMIRKILKEDFNIEDESIIQKIAQKINL